MKYDNVSGFTKHIEASAQKHLSAVYLIIHKEEGTRKTLLQTTLHFCPKPHITFSCDSCDPRTLLLELQTGSLFSPQKSIVLHQIEKAKKAQEVLLDFLKRPQPSIYLVLETGSLSPTSPLYKEIEKIGVIFDGSKEKAWMKEKALVEWVKQEVQKRGKKINDQVAADFIRQIGREMAVVPSELDKLCLYIGKQVEITGKDIAAICIKASHETIWQLGDAIFARDRKGALAALSSLLAQEESVPLVLIKQIRSQMETKFQVASMLAEGRTPGEITEHYPYMQGQILGRNISQAQTFGLQSLKQALILLDETEFQLKNAKTDPKFLIEITTVKLTYV